MAGVATALTSSSCSNSSIRVVVESDSDLIITARTCLRLGLCISFASFGVVEVPGGLRA